MHDFLTRLMLYLSESSLFCGTANRKMPSISTKNLQDGLYRFAGMMMDINRSRRIVPLFWQGKPLAYTGILNNKRLIDGDLDQWF